MKNGLLTDEGIEKLKKEVDKIVKSGGKITLWDEIRGFLSMLFKRKTEEYRPDGYHLILQ